MSDPPSEQPGGPLFLDVNKAGASGAARGLAAGIGLLFLAGLTAICVYQINLRFAGEPEKALKIVGAVFALLMILPAGVYLAARRSEARLNELGALIVGSVGVLAIACFFFYAGYFVALPADIVIWSESDYVNDILKFRKVHPLFTDQVNNESFTYVPGSQLVTYFIAWLAGKPLSIPVYRAVQLLFTLFSVIVAFLCYRRILVLMGLTDASRSNSTIQGAAVFCILFLIAVNSITNPFAHLLHNDALAQLFIVIAFWTVTSYESTKDKRTLLIMALMPAVGFWIKQSLVIWGPLVLVYLLVFERPRLFRRAAVFGVLSAGATLASILTGYLLWEDNFIYWIFTVLGAHAVSPLRSVRHLLIVWPYFVLGLVAGGAFAGWNDTKRLIGPWAVWLAIISIETYTSGIAWMTNHIGPGCLIAGVLFLAALTPVWSTFANNPLRSASSWMLFRCAVFVAAACLFFGGLGFVRIPTPPFSESDAARYIRQIENEFAGLPASQVLLDVGTWVYLPDGVVMKDRAPSIGERGLSETGDFSGILGRLKQRAYQKILVRNFHSGDFWYDHELWATSSMIRKALDENYREIGRIEAVSGMAPNDLPYGFREISILVPRDR